MNLFPSIRAVALGFIAVIALSSNAANATVVFSDNFDSGASADWGNERGAWRDTDGVYDASAPDNNPITYSSVTSHTSLTDFRVRVDVNNLDDGGIWLRSDFNGGAINGVLLVTGGNNGNADILYWHTVQNGAFSRAQQSSFIPGLQDSDIALTIDVVGDSYTAYIDGNAVPATSLTTALFASGSVGLYDYSPTSGASSPRGQTFDNFSIETLTVAEPAALAVLVSGFASLIATRRKNGKAVS
jgi:hypothetical protein